VENVFPDPSDGVPQLSRLPRIWTQHYQSYHPQTLRDLLKRAEELQLTVRVQLAEGTEQEGVPVKVEIQLGFWHVTLDTRAGKSRLRLDDIQRVRMLLPDYVQI
jgi:3-keto-L-gulonate-6-phosphate decarboxylase